MLPPSQDPELRKRTLWTGIGSPVFICVVAFLLRASAIALIQTGRLSHIWESGPEIVNIATEIARHRGFSSPFGIESGATAWIPPVYPGMLALIFGALGVGSNLAAVAVLGIQALFSAATVIPLYAIARRIFDNHAALCAAWAWALFPYEVVMPGLFVWETFLSGFLAVLLCYFSMRESVNEPWTPFGLGVFWGIAALTNTALLSLMPVFLFFRYRQRHGSPERKRIATVILAAFLTTCPWTVRNWFAFRTIVPVRSNAGEELWKGNHKGGIGRIQFGTGPADNLVQRERYLRLGEINYVRQRGNEALEFIRQDPGRYGRLILYRLEYWWFAQGESAPIFFLYRLLSLVSLCGIVLAWGKRKNPGMLHMFGAVVVYPLVYYLTDVYARYRYPIEPFLMIFAGFALSHAFAFAQAKVADRNRLLRSSVFKA